MKEFTPDAIAQAEADFARSRAILVAAKRQADLEVAQRYVGKYFTWRNRFKDATSEDDYWLLYLAITGVAEDGQLESWFLQTTPTGIIEIGTKNRMPAGMLTGPGYEEIDQAAFLAAYNAAVTAVAALRGTITAKG